MNRLLYFLFLITVVACTSDNEEDYFDVDCDTDNVYYTANNSKQSVSAIISNKCLGCHAKGNSLFIPPLETYNEVKSYANLDSIINGLTDTPMPPESAMQLTDCEKLQIESWVTNEFPEYE